MTAQLSRECFLTAPSFNLAIFNCNASVHAVRDDVHVLSQKLTVSQKRVTVADNNRGLGLPLYNKCI